MGAHYLFHVRLVERTGIEAQRANQVYLYEGAQAIGPVSSSLTPAVILQACIKGVRLAQALYAQLVAHEWAAFAHKMRGAVKTGLLMGVGDAFSIIVIDFSSIAPAILPSRPFRAP